MVNQKDSWAQTGTVISNTFSDGEGKLYKKNKLYRKSGQLSDTHICPRHKH